MRLIDADALTERMKSFLCAPTKCDNYGGIKCRACQFDDAFNWIDSEPTADSVPIKPLANWLAGYAMPPGASKVIGEYGIYRFESRVEAWEDFLRGMNWEGADE